MDPVHATLLGTVFGGGCAIFSAWFGAKFAVNYQMRRNAEQVFIDSIHEILVGMYPEPIDWPRNSWQTLSDKLPAIHCAIQKVIFHLKPEEIGRINTAWLKYKEYCRQINDAKITARKFDQVSQPSVDQKVIFKKHVDLLLSYSKKA